MTDPTPRRIFVIGFNKCGTTSFHEYFRANAISSVHWRGNTLALALHETLGKCDDPSIRKRTLKVLHRTDAKKHSYTT